MAFLVVRMIVVVFRKLVDPELVFEGKFADVVLSWDVEASVIWEVLLPSVDSCEVAPVLEYVVSSFALATILAFKQLIVKQVIKMCNNRCILIVFVSKCVL